MTLDPQLSALDVPLPPLIPQLFPAIEEEMSPCWTPTLISQEIHVTAPFPALPIRDSLAARTSAMDAEFPLLMESSLALILVPPSLGPFSVQHPVSCSYMDCASPS